MYEKKGNSHHNEKKGNSHDHYKCYIRNRFLVSQDPDGGMECEDMEMRSVFRLRDHDSIADGVVVIEDGEVIFHPPECGLEPFRLKFGHEYDEEDSSEEDPFEGVPKYESSYTDKEDVELIMMAVPKH